MYVSVWWKKAFPQLFECHTIEKVVFYSFIWVATEWAGCCVFDMYSFKVTVQRYVSSSQAEDNGLVLSF